MGYLWPQALLMRELPLVPRKCLSYYVLGLKPPKFHGRYVRITKGNKRPSEFLSLRNPVLHLQKRAKFGERQHSRYVLGAAVDMALLLCEDVSHYGTARD